MVVRFHKHRSDLEGPHGDEMFGTQRGQKILLIEEGEGEEKAKVKEREKTIEMKKICDSSKGERMRESMAPVKGLSTHQKEFLNTTKKAIKNGR